MKRRTFILSSAVTAGAFLGLWPRKASARQPRVRVGDTWKYPLTGDLLVVDDIQTKQVFYHYEDQPDIVRGMSVKMFRKVYVFVKREPKGRGLTNAESSDLRLAFDNELYDMTWRAHDYLADPPDRCPRTVHRVSAAEIERVQAKLLDLYGGWDETVYISWPLYCDLKDDLWKEMLKAGLWWRDNAPNVRFILTKQMRVTRTSVEPAESKFDVTDGRLKVFMRQAISNWYGDLADHPEKALKRLA